MFDLEFCRHVFYVEFFFWRSQQLNFAYYSLITQQLNFAYSPTTEVKGSSLFPKGSKMVSKISLSEAALRFKVAPRLHTQKRHRPVTTCYSLLHLQAWYRYDIIAVSGCWCLQTVQNWRYQAGTVCWFVSAVSVWCNRMIQVCWEQTVAVCKNGL